MRSLATLILLLAASAAEAHDFYRHWYEPKPQASRRSFAESSADLRPAQPPIAPRPTYRKWKVMAQYGAGHTVLVPAWQQSQRGAYDNVVVPNGELDFYDIVHQPEWVVPVTPRGTAW